MDALLRAGLSNAVAATVMAIGLTCLSRPLARRPAILHGLWVLVLLKLISPPFYELPIPWPVLSPDSAASHAEFAVAEAGPDGRLALRGDAMDQACDIAMLPWPAEFDGGAALDARHSAAIPASFFAHERWIGAAWLVGSASVVVLSVRRIRRFRRSLADARESSWLEQEWVDDWARRLGLRRAPELLWVPGRIAPMVWFIGLRPRLIMPEGLWKRLNAEQRATLLAHELAHLRRGDHYVRLLELLATALFWWHPLVWWMRGPLRDVEEQCCDAWVVWALPDAVRAYAESLLDTLEFLEKSDRPEPLLASGLGKVPHLRRRLTMIMTGSSRRLTGRAGKLGLLIAAGAMLPIGATWAQKADEPKEVRIVVKADQDAAEVAEDVVRTTADPTTARGYFYPARATIEDIVEQLQAQIAELKKAEESSEGSKERVRVLERAIVEIKKAHGTANPVIVRLGDPNAVKLLAVDKGKDTPEIEKLRVEVSGLRRKMESTLKELQAAQDKIRNLGGDPGDAPVVRWTRSLQNVHYTVVKPVRDRVEREVTYTISKPIRTEKAPTLAKGSSDGRIEALEKRLKELTDEVQRLKKDSAEAGSRR